VNDIRSVTQGMLNNNNNNNNNSPLSQSLSPSSPQRVIRVSGQSLSPQPQRFIGMGRAPSRSPPTDFRRELVGAGTDFGQAQFPKISRAHSTFTSASANRSVGDFNSFGMHRPSFDSLLPLTSNERIPFTGLPPSVVMEQDAGYVPELMTRHQQSQQNQQHHFASNNNSNNNFAHHRSASNTLSSFSSLSLSDMQSSPNFFRDFDLTVPISEVSSTHSSSMDQLRYSSPSLSSISMHPRHSSSDMSVMAALEEDPPYSDLMNEIDSGLGLTSRFYEHNEDDLPSFASNSPNSSRLFRERNGAPSSASVPSSSPLSASSDSSLAAIRLALSGASTTYM